MDTLRTKSTWNRVIRKFKKSFTGFSANSTMDTENREDERLRKILQQREEFIKWANTF